MSVAVIGAGPAGLAAAFALTKVIPNVDVDEASDSVGGLARSLRLWGQTVDLGPHRFFSRDRRVNELWLEVVGRDYAMVRRLTRILYKGRFFQYPLEPMGALGSLGISEAARCATSYAWAKLRPPPKDGSFEAWVTSRFGRRLFEIFFESYSEKLWGIPCSELDADFAAQRIKGFRYRWRRCTRCGRGAASHIARCVMSSLIRWKGPEWFTPGWRGPSKSGADEYCCKRR